METSDNLSHGNEFNNCVEFHIHIMEIAVQLIAEWKKTKIADKFRTEFENLNGEQLYMFINFGDAIPEGEIDLYDYAINLLMEGSFRWGTGSGYAFDRDPRAQILMFYLAYRTNKYFASARFELLDEAMKFILFYPQEASWIFRILIEHAKIVQESFIKAGCHGNIPLVRGTHEGFEVCVLESWTSMVNESVDHYGEIRLEAEVPIENIISFRTGPECEVVVSRISLNDFTTLLLTGSSESRKKGLKWLIRSIASKLEKYFRG